MATITVFQKDGEVYFHRATICDFERKYDDEHDFIAVVDLSTGEDEVFIHFNNESNFFAFCEKHNIEVEDKRENKKGEK